MTKILLVEDDKSLREIYGVRLLAEGYDIISAGDGEAALAMAIKDRPDLILSDVMMPKISGFDMLDILRSTTETKNIKVIMMTALSSEDQRQRGESLGADRYLVKSQVGIEDVVRTVHEVLGDAPTGAPAQPATPPAAGTTVTPTPNVPGQTANPVPTPPTPPQPAPVAPAPPNPTASVPPRPAAAPAPSAAQQPTPAAPAPQPAKPADDMPQPTAPFSTPRPANLGDRVIQPITSPESEVDDLAKRLQEELSGAQKQPEPIMPDAPQAEESAPAPSEPARQPISANIDPNLQLEDGLTPEPPADNQPAGPQSP